MKWTLDLPDSLPEDCEKLKMNYEYFNLLMENFQFSGLFSEELLKKVFTISYKVLELRKAFHRGNLSEKDCNTQVQELYNEFERIFTTYCIFSQQFTTHVIGLFHVVAYKNW